MSDEGEQALAHLGRKNSGADSVSWQVVTEPSLWDFISWLGGHHSTSPVSSQRFFADFRGGAGGWRNWWVD